MAESLSNTADESAEVSVIRHGDTPIALLCRFRYPAEDADPDTAESADEEDGDRTDTDEAEDAPPATGETADEEDAQSSEAPHRITRKIARKQQQWRILATPQTDKSARSTDSRGDASLLPVHAGWSKYPFLTRPYTLRDFRLLRARQHPRAHWQAQNRFDIEPKIRRRGERKKIPRLTVHARTLWKLEHAGSFRMGAEQAEQSCWFLFVDGALVADWRSSVPQQSDSGTRLDQNILHLEAGLHAVDFFSVVKHYEPLPNPVFATGDSPVVTALAEADLLPPVSVDSLRFEQLEDEEPSGRALTLERRPHLLFEQAPGAESLLVPAPRTVETQRRTTVRDFAPRHIGVPDLTAVSASLDLGSIPIMHPLGAPFFLHPRLSATSRRGQVPAERLKLEVAVRSRSDELETRTTLTPETLPFAPRVPLPLTAKDESVVIRALFGEHHILPAREIRLISAADFGPSLSFAGAHAMLKGEPASLLWQPNDSVSETFASAERLPLRRLFILDDFWDIAPVPGQEQAGAERLSKSLDIPVNHISIAAMRRKGVPDRAAKFAMLAQAMETATAGDHILFAVGGTDLLEERQALDLVAELDFLAGVCRAHQLQPVFVTLPSQLVPDNARVRRAALYTKELAVRLAIPVVDLYSAAKLDADAPFSPAPPVNEAQSHLEKRRWISDQTIAFLVARKH